MSVRIQFDNPSNVYTNLDFISGRIFLNIFRFETIAAILVKLEGESKTRLAVGKGAPGSTITSMSQDSKKVEVEVHKVDGIRLRRKFHSTDLDQAIIHCGSSLSFSRNQNAK